MQQREAEIDRIPDVGSKPSPFRFHIFPEYKNEDNPVSLGNGGFFGIDDTTVLYHEHHRDEPEDERKIGVGDTLVRDIDRLTATWHEAGTPRGSIEEPWGAGFSGVVIDIVEGELELKPDAEHRQALGLGLPRGLGYIVHLAPTR